MPASQLYKVRPCRIKTQEFAVFCERCIRYQAGDILLDGRYLHNCRADFDTLCERLLGLMPASQLHKVCLCRIKTHEFAVFCGGYISYQAGDTLLDGRYLHYYSMDPDSVCRRLLGMMPAFQRYKVRLCCIEAHEFAVFCRGCIRY